MIDPHLAAWVRNQAWKRLATERSRRIGAVRGYLETVLGPYDPDSHLGRIRDDLLAIADGGEP